MNNNTLVETIARLIKSPKGILAMDESLNTCNRRFSDLGVSQTEEKRREYRELLITTPSLEKYISGCILFDETIRQSTLKGKSFTSVLTEKGIEIGIKVDQGLEDYIGHPAEKITNGLEGLERRLSEYKKLGATFAKWRAVFKIGEKTPSDDCIRENAEFLARYALLCQTEDIVPIVEPEVLMEGAHSQEKCYEVTARSLDAVFSELKKLDVFMPGVILKTNMVLAGKDAKEKSSPEEVAKMTLKCLTESVPRDIGGIVFLSGGQSDEDATKNLNAMHNSGPLPWPLTFSYARAIQNQALKYWAENPADIKGAQDLLINAARNNSEASIGKYKK